MEMISHFKSSFFSFSVELGYIIYNQQYTTLAT